MVPKYDVSIIYGIKCLQTPPEVIQSLGLPVVVVGLLFIL